MKKRVLLTGIILFLVVAAGIVMVRFRKPQHTSQTNNSDTYEYYYNNEDEEEEDSLLPENLDSILADNKTVPLDTIPSSTTVLVNRKYLLPSTYIPKNLVVPNVDFSFPMSMTNGKCAKLLRQHWKSYLRQARKRELDYMAFPVIVRIQDKKKFMTGMSPPAEKQLPMPSPRCREAASIRPGLQLTSPHKV